MTHERNATLSSYRNTKGRLVYKARIWLADGDRIRVPIGVKNRFDEVKARAEADAIQAEERATNAFLNERRAERRAAQKTTVGESASEWHARFTLTRTHGEALGDAQRWAKWIDPVLGSKPIADVQREDVEGVRDVLDEAIGDGRLAAKTAATVWSILCTAMRHATTSKDKGLRVLASNPCKDVMPPERGDSRQKAFIYPNEASKLFACEAVPARIRALYAVAAFTFVRPNELAALRRSDIDFDARVVRISRALDWRTKEAKPPKTRNGIRVVPLHANLLPLLELLCSEPGARDDLLFPDFRNWGKHKAAGRLRDHLRLAGVDRTRLFAESQTEMMIGNRGWRDSGITWHAIAGAPLQHLQRWAGHDTMDTTMGYVRSAYDYTHGGIGEPFGSLPGQLLANLRAEMGLAAEISVEAPGIEPGSEKLDSPASTCVSSRLNRRGARRLAGSLRG